MKKLEKITLIISIVILSIATILVGSPLENNVEIVKCLLVFVAMLYIIIKLKKKTPIITNILDLFVILLMFSCFIPLIFGTYASRQDTIINILTYISLIAMYFLTKELANNEKSLNAIQYVFLILGVILLIVGIDDLTTNIFTRFLNNLGVPQYRNGEERLISSLGYANSIGIIMAFMYLISINQYTLEKNKYLKSIFGGTSFLFLLGLLLSESKGSIIVLGVIYLIYLFKTKDVSKKTKVLVIAVISAVFSAIYYLIFTKIQENNLLVWISLVLTYIFAAILLALSTKTNKIIEKSLKKLDFKKVILIFMILVLLLVIIFTILLQFKSSLLLFKEENKEVRQTIRNIEGSSIYNFTFDINSKGNKKTKDIYKITIDEENKFDQVISSHEIKLGDYKGKKEINIFTNKDTNKFTIRFNKLIDENVGYLEINSLKINDKEIPVNYKFIPMSLVNNIQSLTLENKNIWERGAFIVDGFKLASKNWVFGIGGNGWEKEYKQIQSYNYDARYLHCYIIKILVENGTIGLIAILGIIAIVIKNLLNSKNKNIVMYLTILMILLHSTIDFDMEFYIIQIFVFSMLGIVSKDIKNIDNKVINYILSIILVIIFIFSGIESIKIMYVNNKFKNADFKELESLEKIVPYSLDVKNAKLNILNNTEDSSMEKINILKEIKKDEKYYNQTLYYLQISEYALELKEEEQVKQYLLEGICEYENGINEKLNMYSYEYACQTIYYISEKLKGNNEYDEILKKELEKIIEITDEFNKNIPSYEITRKSEEEYLEYKNSIERYRKYAELGLSNINSK